MTERLRVALKEVSAAASAFSETTTDFDVLLQTITRSCARALKSTCTLSLFDDDTATVTPVAVFDDDPKLVEAFQPMMRRPRRYEESLLGQLGPATGNVFLPRVEHATLRARLAPDAFEFCQQLGVRGIIVIAMRVRGETLGILGVMQHGEERPLLDDFDREIATHLAHLAGFALSNARLFKRAQDELDGRRTATHANAFLDAILENVPAMVFVKDAERLEFVRLNRAGEEFLGIPRQELVGKSDRDFFPADEAAFFVAKDRETLNNKHVVDIPEEPILTAHGERWLHTRKVPILDEHGEPRYLVGISHDITEKRREVAALQQARDRAEEANAELEAFSYSVAHDLRAPLRAIDGFSQALIDDYGPALDEVGRGYAMRVRASAQRMAALIDDLLALSRVTRMQLDRRIVDIGDLFRTANIQCQRLDPDRVVELVIPESLRARADPKLLAIAFDNLVGNAWKFTARAAAPRIELSASVVAGELVFCIADNGVGFDMAYSHKLFGVFSRLHTDVEFAGTGVGLATVQRVIARHGGRVWAEAEVGNGARFYFTLGDTRGA